MLVIIWLVSIVSFLTIELPPGDYLSSLIASLEAQGSFLSKEEINSLRTQYGLNLPVHSRYIKWINGFFIGDFGYSFEWQKPVSEIINERLALTLLISLITIFFAYTISIPIGVYSATHQYTLFDYFITTIGFIGLATPNFMIALILLFVGLKWFGVSLDGLFSEEFLYEPWSIEKFIDMLKHLPIPVIVVGTASTAGLIRVLRASLLDELQKQYVITARSKGLGENKLLFKYPVRIALNPIISEFAMVFPQTISGGAITAVVLGLPTAGPLLLRALISQDTYLAATILMFITILVVVGTTIADLFLVLLDPRIRLDKKMNVV